MGRSSLGLRFHVSDGEVEGLVIGMGLALVLGLMIGIE